MAKNVDPNSRLNQYLFASAPGEEQLHEHTLFGPDGLYGSKEMASRLANTSYSVGEGLLSSELL